MVQLISRSQKKGRIFSAVQAVVMPLKAIAVWACPWHSQISRQLRQGRSLKFKTRLLNKMWLCLKMVSTPLNPMVLLIIIPIK